LGRIANISLLAEKIFLGRKAFKMEGPGNGNGIPYSNTGDKDQDEVKRLYCF
jgi:hypothetical protein